LNALTYPKGNFEINSRKGRKSEIESSNKMRLINTYDRLDMFVFGLIGAVTLTLFLLIFSCSAQAIRADNNDPTIHILQHPRNNNGSINFLTYREPDLGIKILYPSNWLKREVFLVLHTVADFVLVHTDTHDRTNTTYAEFALRIFPQNSTLDVLSVAKQINAHNKESILNSYKDPAAKSGFLVLRTFNNKSMLEELQVWTTLPTKHIIVERLYIADRLNYARYLPVAEKIIQSYQTLQ
jgi:hypothetical protein